MDSRFLKRMTAFVDPSVLVGRISSRLPILLVPLIDILPQIELRNGTVELAILPNKFKKLIWLKRGDYLIASTSTQDPNVVDSGKVKYLIKSILNKDQIKHLHDLGLWYDPLITSDDSFLSQAGRVCVREQEGERLWRDAEL